MEIQGRSAIVTGAGRGIGRAVALHLARAGARVTAVSRTAAELDALVAEIREEGGQAQAFPADLRAPAAGAAAVEAAVAAHAGLQILVNNAGIGSFSNLADTSDADWDDVFSTNLTAVFRITRAALPHLKSAGGHVFMISSLAGSNAIAGMSAYCASKAALDHLARCLMLEVRQQGVKVTSVAPGSVDTGFGGAPRPDGSWMLTPDDIARTLVDLLRTRDDAHLSRIEMRPARPQKRT
jgi:3-oxoacyl-[acyl-carrier protein] reductase